MRGLPDSLRKEWQRRIPPRWRIFVIAAIAGPLAAFLFAWSGIYNVAASRGHFRIVEWALAFVMNNSVVTHAALIKEPPLDDPNLLILGASHFYTSCAPCHGGPGQQPNAALQNALPPAPDLHDTAERWKGREIYWIVRHGIKYTGMPAWPAQSRDDEVWAVVAFIKALPKLDAPRYRGLAIGNLDPAAVEDLTIATCVACHGGSNGLPRSNLVPILHGQSAAYLALAMREYASGRRHSGIMQPVASDVPPGAIERLARQYAGLQPRRPETPSFTFNIREGERLAIEGMANNAVPPCMACHGPNALETYPRLAGQNPAYFVARMKRYRNEKIDTTDGAAIMRPIAAKLTDQQIQDLAAYFAASGSPGR
jgi:cytochrome c553